MSTVQVYTGQQRIEDAAAFITKTRGPILRVKQGGSPLVTNAQEIESMLLRDELKDEATLIRIQQLKKANADAPLYELADTLVQAVRHDLSDMSGDRLRQKLVDLLKEPRFVPQPGPQENGCGGSEPICDDQGET